MPKISGKNLSEHRGRTHRMLFTTLSGLIAAKGSDAINMSGLASESGTDRAAIYNHFPDKEELLLAYAEFKMSAYMDCINSKLARADSPLNGLHARACEQMLARRGYLFLPGAPLCDVVSRETVVAPRRRTSVMGKLFRRILGECIEVGAIPDQGLDVTAQLLQGTLTGRRVPEDEPTHSAFPDTTDRFVLHLVEVSVLDDLALLSP